MDLSTAFQLLVSGESYCLWVGAGVSKHLARAGDVSLPDWREFVEALESTAGVSKPSTEINASFSERLQVCLTKLGHLRFQQSIREHIYDNLSLAIREAAKKHGLLDPINAIDVVPVAVRQLARLGMRANPIVNFNIETITSIAIAQPGGLISVRSFMPQRAGVSLRQSNGPSSIPSGTSAPIQYQRVVYHPHGAINTSGLSVLTAQDYERLKGTLAFELAVHSAFQSRLVIVGMSLEDAYLREQLHRFRSHIQSIIWFTVTDPSPEIARWIWLNNVEQVKLSNWPEFWKAVDDNLPAPTELMQLQAWETIVFVASSGSTTYQAIKRFKEVFPEMKDNELAEWHLQAVNMGEMPPTGKESLPDSVHDELLMPILKQRARLILG